MNLVSDETVTGEAFRINLGPIERVRVRRSGAFHQIEWPTPQLPSEFLHALDGVFEAGRRNDTVRVLLRPKGHAFMGRPQLQGLEHENVDNITQAGVFITGAGVSISYAWHQAERHHVKRRFGAIALNYSFPETQIKSALEQTGSPSVVDNIDEISMLALSAFDSK